MKSKTFIWTISGITLLALAAGISALAQDQPLPEHRSGILSDDTDVVAGAGPWEMRGHWFLDLNHRSNKADFSAYLTMELSDADAPQGASRNAHTHHIIMRGAMV
ncbi:MAG TPA: hypothetical protein VLV88_10850 [Terriglobales bacterium]|nr:hypothetical protein [Terriglobales bacterium]